ncbi:MAG: hypothetical protein ABI673_01365 [Novosphingobium sp.]
MSMRPASMRSFERLYLFAIIVGVVDALRSIDHLTVANQLGMGRAPVIAALFISTGFSLLLWFLTARKGNVVAMWLLVAVTASEVLFLVWKLANLSDSPALGLAVTFTLTALKVLALSYLFRADARLWLRAEAH